ncbi:MAG: NAD(P)/FAD-dependent oxidoreductase [Polyangiaceae bacterium]
MTRALVVGGSMAGMCAARVLADHVDEVTIVDRDVCPSTPEHRIGVPQSHHVHALLARGQRELDRLFPGFTGAVLAKGGNQIDAPSRFATLRRWGWQPVVECGLQSLWASRTLLESVVREKVRAVRNVSVRERTSAIELLVDRGDRARVRGLKVRTESGAEDIAADLVIDASGRGSKAAQWLTAAGLPAPDDETVEPFAGYASRFYRRPRAEERPPEWWWDGLWIEGVPPDFPRGGVAFPIEGDRWLVTAVGFAKDYPPGDERGYVEFLESLASPIIARAVARCEPLSDIVVNRSTTNRFRRYDTWTGALDGFLALGDAVCAFNPVYGQGMSTAAVCACLLEETLRSVGPSPRGLPPAHFAAQAEFLKSVWALASGADFVWPTTVGRRPRGGALFRPYLHLLGESLHCDPELMRRVIGVFHLVEHPRKAAAPATVGAVIGSTIRRRLRGGLRAPSIAHGTLPPERPVRS